MQDKNTVGTICTILALAVVAFAFLKWYKTAWVFAALDVGLLIYTFTRREN